ncbi:MAG: CBS domain-containing protein [Halobacteriota archaeon]|nr:CBS domain-containing protein [Halobacteriota archaeon]
MGGSVTSIEDIISENYEKIDAEETLSHALSMFRGEEDDKSVLLVFKGKKYVGIITQRIILRSRLNVSEKIKTLVKASPKASINDDIYHISKLMFENELKFVPVFDNSKIVGVVRDEDVLDLMSKTEFGKRIVKELMTEDLVTVDENETIASMVNKFRENGISRLPVLSKEKLAGMVTVHDFMKVIVPKNRPTTGSMTHDKFPLLSMPVKDIMSENLVTIKPDDSVKDAVEKMIERGITGLVVYEDGMRGMITKTDLLGAISRMGQEEMNFFVQFSGEITSDMDRIVSELTKFTDKFERYLKQGVMHIYFKHHGQMFNDVPLVLCKIKISSPKGSFVGKGEGWGEEAAFHIALDHVERHVLKTKEMVKDKWAEKRLLEKISF